MDKKNKYTLLITPDSGNEIKIGEFSAKRVFFSFLTLTTILFFILFFSFGTFIKYKQEKVYKQSVMTNEKLTNKIQELNPTYLNIIEFIEYFDEKKEELKNTEDELTALKLEHNNLEPIVKVNREIVDTILNKQLNKQYELYQKHKWRDIVISFVLGIISSIFGDILTFKYYEIGKSKKLMKKDISKSFI